MSFTQELQSWISPGHVDVGQQLHVESKAPSTSELQFPRTDSRPVIVTFLRHCGCPFAEKTFISLRKTAEAHRNIHCIAVSHSDEPATAKWLEFVGGAGVVEVIVDHERKMYGAYGLGVSSFWHVLNPWSMSNVFKLGREENIWNRPTESGSRWQTAGTFAVDSSAVVKYVQVAHGADDIGDFEKAVESLKKP